MADYHAIGAVSATLQTLLTDRMEQPDALKPALVTIGPPAFSSEDADPRNEKGRVNLFLYRVTENGYLQNQQIPGRGSSSGYGHPPLSLNLHYLLTAYGNLKVDTQDDAIFNETLSQTLLGSAMRVLHDVPVITDRIMTVRPVSGRRILDQSLLDQFEQVKLSLEPLTLEDITKVWTALALRYRLSAPYVVNVVQIESQRPSRFPRPVGQPISPTIPPLPSDPPSPGPMVYVPTIQMPTITELRVRRDASAAEQPFPYANVGDTVVLRGTSLAGPVTRVAFGDIIVPASVAHGDRVEAKIPDTSIPGGGPIPTDQQLEPGVQLVRVIVSDPFVPKSDVASNDVAFMLVPYVEPAQVSYDTPTRKLKIGGTRLIGATAAGETVIGRSAVPRSDYSGWLASPPNPPTPTQIAVPVPDTLPALHVRAVVGGPLGPSIALGGALSLSIKIGSGAARTIMANAVGTLSPDDAAAMLQGLIRDKGNQTATVAADPGFTGARVEVWRDAQGAHLVVVPGGLTRTVTINADPLATALKLDLGELTNNATSALVSGALDPLPMLTAASPRIQLVMNGQASLTIALQKPTSLAGLASDLQAKIRAAVGGAPTYAKAIVATSGSQLLIIPGNQNDSVTVSAAPGDDTTVGELQLHALFAVRVRVNGAESIDRPGTSAVVELPQ